MLWNTICVNNFFENPDDVVGLSNSFEYHKDQNGMWPGIRTKSLAEIHREFFIWNTKKIMAVIFPNEYQNLFWTCTQHFQKINPKEQKGEGWVHRDENEFTSIVYLSKNPNNGTAIFKNKNFFNYKIDKNTEIKKDYILNNKNQNSKIYQESLKDNNRNFEKTASFDSIYNRLIIFDGSMLHGVNSYDNENNEERLTLISFFYDIHRKDGTLLKYPNLEHRRI